eukprot:TRINITY_DN98514_c0_g1_i1.p1 TRINITY_DN98514_c0_g1~~TRINITY_DN98514_c0_g1_i1.p1  ORF type:complete len:246 (+),score=48.51 TRINITY_DN98514_c0_g1_i1:106-843(+)
MAADLSRVSVTEACEPSSSSICVEETCAEIADMLMVERLMSQGGLQSTLQNFLSSADSPNRIVQPEPQSLQQHQKRQQHPNQHQHHLQLQELHQQEQHQYQQQQPHQHQHQQQSLLQHLLDKTDGRSLQELLGIIEYMTKDLSLHLEVQVEQGSSSKDEVGEACKANPQYHSGQADLHCNRTVTTETLNRALLKLRWQQLQLVEQMRQRQKTLDSVNAKAAELRSSCAKLRSCQSHQRAQLQTGG